MCGVCARKQENEVQRKAQLSAQRLGANVSGFDLFRQPEKEVPWIQSGGDALTERATTHNPWHIRNVEGWSFDGRCKKSIL